MVKFLHVVVTLRGEGKKPPRFLFGDLDEAGLKRKFLKPYRRGESIVVGNDLVPLPEVRTVKIVETDEPREVCLTQLQKQSSEAIDRFNAHARETGAVLISIGSGWADEDIVEAGEDVTDRYIKSGPGSEQNALLSYVWNKWGIAIICGIIGSAIVAALFG
jgi:hypothetical protein